MNDYQLQQSTPPRPDQSRGWKIAAFVSISLIVLAVAVLWAISDMGWIPGLYEKLAVIFFTWVLLEIALCTAFFRRGERHDAR